MRRTNRNPLSGTFKGLTNLPLISLPVSPFVTTASTFKTKPFAEALASKTNNEATCFYETSSIKLVAVVISIS